ncbi:MAG: hypothetical protein QNJ46_28195 [Leptolyngbyaceae cyanobacterium MO_188.B28]|nr:hypothetical protein [Leptolyngbyaceae cyanobacterium MO_188.B28]
MPIGLSPQAQKSSAISQSGSLAKWRWRLLSLLAALLLACLWVLLSARPAIAT